MNQIDEIQRLARLGLAKMETDSFHNFDWRIRREIYRKLIGIDQSSESSLFPNLMVKTADYVLPILQSTFPEDHLPKALLDMAKFVIVKDFQKDHLKVVELLDEGYLAIGIDNLTWRDKIDYSAEYAGSACYKALVEINAGQSMLENIEDQHGQYNRFFLSHLPEPKAEVFDADFADFAHLAAFGDTAGAAAIAFACSQEKFDLDRVKLKTFWTWWVNHAIFSIF
ncbi:MAG: Imm5 family immunity protein [Anaerolineae bacterium]